MTLEHADQTETSKINGEAVALGVVASPNRRRPNLRERLAQRAPGFAALLARGEFRTAREAAVAAGLLRWPTPLESAQRAFRKLSKTDALRFLAWLPGGLVDDADAEVMDHVKRKVKELHDVLSNGENVYAQNDNAYGIARQLLALLQPYRRHKRDHGRCHTSVQEVVS